MRLSDIHCHLYDVENINSEIENCKELGFSGILCVSEDLQTMEKTLKLKEIYGDIVYPALGIHPVFISLNSNEEIEKSFEFLKNNIKKAYAIGEIGLDFKFAKDEREKKRQFFWLNEQLKLAKSKGKPVNLHSRRALRETMEEGIKFYKETGLPVLLHWFTHSKKLIKIAVEENLYISAGPSVLYDENIFETAKEIPLKNLLFESDAPVPFCGVPSKPSCVYKILKKFSKEYNIDEKELSEIVFENFKNYLSI